MAKMDVLHRSDFVEQIIKIILLSSVKKDNITFAIDGEWGSGKTFVLDMLEERLKNENGFVVFHYNCWQYDYYDEPLIAIISSLIDEIDHSKKHNASTISKEVLKNIGHGILSLCNETISKATGIDALQTYDAIKNTYLDVKSGIEKNNDYNEFYSFNKNLGKLQKEIQKQAKSKTIILVVDELDRCLPEYAIKVLERLHHLTTGCENIITILAIDKLKLKYTIGSIFGDKVFDRYLEKFIQFEVAMDNGIIDDHFQSIQQSYFDLFENTKFEKDESQILNIYDAIFNGIDIRSQIHIIQKAEIIHKLLFSAEQKHSKAFMLAELLISTFVYYYGVDILDDDKKVPLIITNGVIKQYKSENSDVEYLTQRINSIIEKECSEFIRRQDTAACITVNKVKSIYDEFCFLCLKVLSNYPVITMSSYILPGENDIEAEDLIPFCNLTAIIK